MVWDPDDADSWKNPEDRQKDPPKRNSAEIEERYQTIAKGYFRAAKSISDRDFLFLRMRDAGLSSERIAARLKIPEKEVEDSLTRTGCYLWVRFSLVNMQQLERKCAAICQHGHTTACEACEERLHLDCRYCPACGEKNSEFDHDVFFALRGYGLTQERLSECRKGHPRQRAADNTDYCASCGKDLELLQGTDS